MSSDSDRPENQTDESAPDTAAEGGDVGLDTNELAGSTGVAEFGGERGVEHLGLERYVHVAFFGAAMLTAFLTGKVLESLWNSVSEYPEAVSLVPQLIEYSEEDRGSLTLVIGAVVGVLFILRYYRRPSVRTWATDVAGELARVTWPNQETVTNGTIVVLVAGAIATIYIALLDRLWGYLTNLIYGA